MHEIDTMTRRLAGLDLNLLLALHALLQTRNVTHAARQLGRTQSSVSHALQRLRDTLGDPLLVRSGRRLVPTPRAMALEGPILEIIAVVARLFDAEPTFDPATSTRRFVIACPDLATPLIPDLLARLSKRAPHLAISITAPGPGWAAKLASGAIDLAIGASDGSVDSDLVRRVVGAVNFAVLARCDHPVFADEPLNIESWTRWPHVVVQTGNESPNRLQQQLDAREVTRRVGLEVPGFLMALHVVARTDLLFAAPRELVSDLAAPLGLSLRPLPVALPPLPVALFWHPRVQEDAGHLWLREQLSAEVAARLAARDASAAMALPTRP